MGSAHWKRTMSTVFVLVHRLTKYSLDAVLFNRYMQDWHEVFYQSYLNSAQGKKWNPLFGCYTLKTFSRIREKQELGSGRLRIRTYFQRWICKNLWLKQFSLLDNQYWSKVIIDWRDENPWNPQERRPRVWKLWSKSLKLEKRWAWLS